MTIKTTVLNIDIEFSAKVVSGYTSANEVNFDLSINPNLPAQPENTISVAGIPPSTNSAPPPFGSSLRDRGVSTSEVYWDISFDANFLSNKTYTDSIDFDFKPKESAGESLNIYAGGFDSAELSAQATVWNFHSYVDPIGFLNTITYGKPGIQNSTRTLKPGGWQSSLVSNSLRSINRNVKIAPKSIDAQSFGRNSINNLTTVVETKGFQSSSVSKPVSIINANRKLYPAPIQSLDFGKPEQVLNLNKDIQPIGYIATRFSWHFIENSTSTIGAAGFQSSVVATSLSVTNFYKTLKPASFVSSSVGLPGIHNLTSVIDPKGWQGSSVGKPEQVVNYNKNLRPSSWLSSTTGKPAIYNLVQYQPLRGFDASEYGKPYLIGGVRWLYPRALDSLTFGKLDLLNTTANQEVKPRGIDSLDITRPNVSPRILYARGIDSLAVGSPNVRDPALKPLGELHTAYGTPTVWFHTRPLAPAGILAYESGYLRIADPTQFVLAPSLVESAIFGDTAIRNLSFKIIVPSIGDSSFSDYTTLTNSNRYYAPNGIDSLQVGTASIVNKTPSIFIAGIEPFDTGTPAIGHAIRSVQPTGFDHLLFGRAVLTKTPEVFPRGHQSSVVGATTIWHKNRTLELSQKGIDSFKAGEQTVWYGQRPISPKSWQSGRYGQAVLTHQLRTIETNGFVRDAYGTAWVSQGTRAIEPQGIYKDFPSNHMVGGTQTVKPVGYEATLWGERIIPISQSIQPLGFSGLWGNAVVDLQTKYIAPVGYISVGQQPADRWGDIVVYNKLQYIVQEYDVNSGLVPPKWSDYLLVANRNIQMNVTGFASMRFGYSQIDNNATPLLPEGIKPPPINIGMISHGIRTIAPEAIEPILMSEWAVVHNGARVIAPAGATHTNYGQPIVANTRRYYSGIGRFESLETGTPMIAYAIRTVDIEPRYSIAPPQINLPTVDLYTRYVGFNGYETVKYGLPSLSIHFNIIGPRWNHRDDFGYGAVKNVTPELQVGAFDSQEFGKAGIRTQWRHVLAQGDTATLFGNSKIADRKQTIKPLSWQDVSVSQKHAVIKTGTPPYVTQNIWLQNESNPLEDGFGIEPSSEPSKPGLNQNVLYQRGHNSQKFGDTFVYSNNLYVEIGISTKNITKGPTITNKIRIIDTIGINNEISVSDNLRVTPFYIKPEGFNQARDRQSFGFNDDKFGSTRVTNQNRFVYPKNHSSSTVGSDSRVYLKDRYIEPPTIRGFAMGFPEIPFTLKIIDTKDYGFNSERHGTAVVSRPPYTGPQTVQAKGFNGLGVGVQRVELLHRELQASGSNSMRMGGSVNNDTPYMWQGLRIGEFVPMKIGAGDTSSFGETRIGLRVREIPVEGFVAFRSEYEPSRFKDRMKVIGTITNNVKSQSIAAGGISSQAMGSTGVKLGQYFIRPDGNSDQFRKSSYSAEFGAPTISG